MLVLFIFLSFFLSFFLFFYFYLFIYYYFVVIVIEIARNERLWVRKLDTFNPILLCKQLWRFDNGFSNCNLRRNKNIGWDRFAGHLTFVIEDGRKTRLWKLTGRPYATRAWFHISRLPIWMSSHFADFFKSCRLLLAMVFCLLNLMPNINLC